MKSIKQRRLLPSRHLVAGIAMILVSFAAPRRGQAQPFPRILFGSCTRDCLQFALQDSVAEAPMLIGFHWPAGVRDGAAPDILFCERWWGPNPGQGPSMGQPSRAADIDGGSWIIAANWRQPQTLASWHDVLVLAKNEIWIDSTPTTDQFDFGIVFGQDTCVAAGGAPEVLTLADRHAIRWRAFVEQDDSGSMDAGCSPAGQAPRGLFAGYVVWSLPAAAFPAPTRSDFLRFGMPHYADLSTLDFSVADPDGLGGSDLDTSDGLVLINPDGAPDSGDEILELQVCPPGGAARWYTVQPVVRGSFGYFDGGTVGDMNLPCALVDVTGDGVPDVADLLVDGYYEFSDGCGAGLGLLWEGDIATSPSPALGGDLAAPPACGLPVACERGLRSGVSPFQPAHEPSALDLRNVQPLGVRSAGPSLVLGWEESLGGHYVVYLGELGVLRRNRAIALVPVNPCDPLTSPEVIVPMPPFDAYYLVTQLENGVESSYGRDSFGRERPHFDPCP